MKVGFTLRERLFQRMALGEGFIVGIPISFVALTAFVLDWVLNE